MTSPTPPMVIAGSLPLVAAIIGLFSGLSVGIRGNGSWTWAHTGEALAATAFIGIGFGGLLVALFFRWNSAHSTRRFFLFVFITLTYGLAALASLVLYIGIAITRDPPEC